MGGLRVSKLVTAVALALALASCGREEADAPTPPAAPPAELITVAQQTAPDYKTVAAVLTNRDVGDARARISGTVQRLLVREGDQVRRGQLLAIVADQRLSLEAQAGNASVAAAEATAERARGARPSWRCGSGCRAGACLRARGRTGDAIAYPPGSRRHARRYRRGDFYWRPRIAY